MSDLQVEAAGEGERLLRQLIERRWLVLARGADQGQFIGGLDRLLATSADKRLKAARVAEWLLARRDVEELFASDDEIARLL